MRRCLSHETLIERLLYRLVHAVFEVSYIGRFLSITVNVEVRW